MLTGTEVLDRKTFYGGLSTDFMIRKQVLLSFPKDIDEDMVTYLVLHTNSQGKT